MSCRPPCNGVEWKPASLELMFLSLLGADCCLMPPTSDLRSLRALTPLEDVDTIVVYNPSCLGDRKQTKTMLRSSLYQLALPSMSCMNLNSHCHSLHNGEFMPFMPAYRKSGSVYSTIGSGRASQTTPQRCRHKRAEVGFTLTIKRLPALCLEALDH